MDHQHPEPPPFRRSPAGLTLLVAAFGDAWRAYAAVTPRFVPHLSKDDRARPVNSH
jgi:hypothetical protein